MDALTDTSDPSAVSLPRGEGDPLAGKRGSLAPSPDTWAVLGLCLAAFALAVWHNTWTFLQGFDNTIGNDSFFVDTLSNRPFAKLYEVFSPSYGSFYRPIQAVYLWAIMHLSHTSPIALHISSVVLNAVIVVMVGLIARRLTGSIICQGIASFLFIFWPGKTSAISWIATAGTLLATLFALILILVWDYARSKHKPIRLIWAISLIGVVSIWSKEDLFGVFVLIFILDVFHQKQRILTSIAALLPLIVATALTVILYKAGYAHWTVATGAAKAWAWDRQRTIGAYCQFADATSLAGLIPFMPFNPMWLRPEMIYPLITGLIAWRVPITRTAWIWHMAGCLMEPTICGRHCVGSRFFYAPDVFASIYVAVCLWAFVIAALRYAGQKRL